MAFTHCLKKRLEIRLGIAPRTVPQYTYLASAAWLLYKLLTHSVPPSLTPWSRVLFEKLTGSQLVKKFHGFCGTRILPHKLERLLRNFHDFSLYNAALSRRRHWTRLGQLAYTRNYTVFYVYGSVHHNIFYEITIRCSYMQSILFHC